MINTISFPTHGEVLNLLFCAFGVLPRKVTRNDDFDEADKKALQKQLNRLASEEGNLLEKYGQAIKVLTELLKKYLPGQVHMDVLNLAFRDLDLAYAEMVRSEGTYLDKLESVRYFISVKAVLAFVIALNRSRLLLGSRDTDGIWSDDNFWYLPTFEHPGRVTTPLAKVLRWAYAACGTSQEQFHCPGKLSDPREPAHQRNLDNAKKWVGGKVLPSLPHLVANFKESFAAQGLRNRAVDPCIQQHILTALVYARVATFIAEEIEDAYGREYLEEVCSQIRQLTLSLQEDVQEFLEQTDHIIEQPSGAQLSPKWAAACIHHEDFVRKKLRIVHSELDRIHGDSRTRPIDPDALKALTRKYGEFAAHAIVGVLQRQATFALPVGFAELLYKGFELKKDPRISLEQISEYEEILARTRLLDALSWLPPWLRGVYYYRRDDYAVAFEHYEEAFELAKYRAGRHQYKLVNQFVELAAKTGKKVPFRQGVHWAKYIGLQIRWLRDDEVTQENLDFVQDMMKVANYSHQL